MWLFKLPDWVKALSQWGHLNGFSPLCIRSWFTKLQDCEKALPHILQTYGFEPVCVRKWMCKLLCVLKVFWQKLHSKPLICKLESTSWCFIKWVAILLKYFLQIGHFSSGSDFLLEYDSEEFSASSLVIIRTEFFGPLLLGLPSIWYISSSEYDWFVFISVVLSNSLILNRGFFLFIGIMEISGLEDLINSGLVLQLVSTVWSSFSWNMLVINKEKRIW